MTMNEYQKLAQRTANPELTAIEKLRNGCYGLCGEAGECIDLLKKHEFQGHELNETKLIDELGDVLWYIAQTAVSLNTTLEEVAQRNIAKLRARYPEGFSANRSVNRKETTV